MNIRYVAQDMDWSQAIKDRVEEKIAAPLARYLKTADFELSMHLRKSRSHFEMWALLQTFDGHGNQIVRRRGQDLQALVSDLSNGLGFVLRRSRNPKRWWLRPLRFQACVS